MMPQKQLQVDRLSVRPSCVMWYPISSALSETLLKRYNRTRTRLRELLENILPAA
jgi:hypothetical protein